MKKLILSTGLIFLSVSALADEQYQMHHAVGIWKTIDGVFGYFDLVITDISLPAMSGLDLARKILNIEPKAPIIIASGYVLDLSLNTWGPNVRSIVKPFEGAEIDALIEELFTAHD